MKELSETKLIVVAGPTASGKSALGLALAEEFHGTVINADSMQVYRDLEILTARPGPEDISRVPHRLYGAIDGADLCSAARWRDLALAAIEEAQGEGRVPILVGGTGLYIRTLLQGIAAVPEISAEVRAQSRALHEELGGVRFREVLAEKDPEGAAKLASGDSQRLMRAYEVVVGTGRSLASWQGEQVAENRFRTAMIGVLPPRPTLYAACDGRFETMMKRGALDEVRRLVARHLDPALPVMKALGVPELIRVLAGEIGREEAVSSAQQATRNYAKRQITWFRNQLPASERLEKLILDAQFSESFLADSFSFIRRFLLT